MQSALIHKPGIYAMLQAINDNGCLMVHAQYSNGPPTCSRLILSSIGIKFGNESLNFNSSITLPPTPPGNVILMSTSTASGSSSTTINLPFNLGYITVSIDKSNGLNQYSLVLTLVQDYLTYGGLCTNGAMPIDLSLWPNLISDPATSQPSVITMMNSCLDPSTIPCDYSSMSSWGDPHLTFFVRHSSN